MRATKLIYIIQARSLEVLHNSCVLRSTCYQMCENGTLKIIVVLMCWIYISVTK